MDINELYEGIKPATIVRLETINALYELKINESTTIDQILARKDESKLVEHIRRQTNLVVEHLDEIHSKINENLTNYTINRLNVLDLCIIELATAELLYSDLNSHIIINEALNITKVYTDTANFHSVSFNNRLLDKIARSLGKL